MISTTTKLKIIDAVKARSKNYVSNTQHARVMGISPSQLSRILKMKPDLDGVLSEANWINIGRKYAVSITGEKELITAKTEVFKYIWTQLELAQNNSMSGILCDRADIGKTHTALMYARENANVAYIDCSRNKSKHEFIRALIKEFGLVKNGTYRELFETLAFYLNTSVTPLVILDEFGDLGYPAYLEFKALWNATDKHCGWYAMGADGLAAKIDNKIKYKKVGFAEIFSRLGNKYQRITPLTDQDFAKFQKEQIAQIGVANGCIDVQRLHAKTNMSLRRIPIQLYIEKQEKK